MAKILIVDDEQGIRVSFKEALRANGHDVLVAEDFEEAIAILKNTVLDVIATDYILRGKNGLELLHFCKKNFPDIEVIMMTGYPTVDVALQTIGLGAFDFLTKPVSISDFRHVVEMAARRKAKIEHDRTILRLNEERYRHLVENSTDLIWRTNFEGQMVDVNPACQNILGYSVSEAVGLNLHEYITSESAERISQWVKEALQAKPRRNHFGGEVDYIPKSGPIVTMDLRATMLSDESGKVVFIEGISRDITAKKRAEKAIRESEENFRAFFDTIGDLIVVTEPGGKILYANKALNRKLGYSPEELRTMFFFQLHSQNQLQEAEKILSEMLKGERESCPLPLMKKSGEFLPVETRIWFGRWNGQECIFSLCKDLSKEQEAQQRFERLFRSNPALMALSSLPDKKFLDVNDAFLKKLGYEKDEVIGKSFTELGLFTETNENKETLAGFLAGERFNDCELQVRCKDGTLLDGLFSAETISSQGRNSVLSVMIDITDRKAAERALKESEDRYRAITELSYNAICVVDESARIVWGNQKLVEIGGYTLEQFYESGTFANFLAPESQEFVFSNFLQFVAGQEYIHHYSFAFVRPDGEKRLAEKYMTDFKDLNGQRKLIINIMDVTDRKKSEENLRESEQRFSNIVNMSPESILTATLEGVITYANPQTARMLGMNHEDEMLNRNILEFLHPEDRERVPDVQRLTMEGMGPGPVEYRGLRRDGSTIVIGVHGELLRDEAGAPHGWLYMIRDMTEQRRAQEALRKSEERFRLLVQNSIDIIEIVDSEGRPSYIGDQITRILGYKPEELMDTPVFANIHPDDLPRVMEIFTDGLAKPGSVGKAEYRYRHKNGEWVDLEAVGCNLLHDPSIKGVVLNVREISERKRAEEEKSRLQAQLQQAMKMEAVGRLAGGVAHDFNNLLTGITGNLQLALLDIKKKDPMGETLKEVIKGAESAAALTRQLLAFSRKQLIEPKALNLNDLISDLHKMLTRLIGEDVLLTLSPGTDLWSVRVDPGQFEQVLVNLAVNARDAMPEGGKLGFETANVRCDEEYCRVHSQAKSGDYVRLSVSDSGQGMSEEVKNHLFEPFFTTKPKGRGTGLGLAMIYGAVKQTGGHIDVHSEEGKGSRFDIYLPRIGEDAQKLKKTGDEQDMVGGTEIILLVEDEMIVRNLAEKILKRLGYHVISASDGKEALELAEKRKEPIDLLVTDVVMPGMNGRQLADRLAAIHPEAKVLYTSGYTEDAIAQHGIIDEGLNFIGKPYSPQALAQKVREALS